MCALRSRASCFREAVVYNAFLQAGAWRRFARTTCYSLRRSLLKRRTRLPKKSVRERFWWHSGSFLAGSEWSRHPLLWGFVGHTCCTHSITIAKTAQPRVAVLLDLKGDDECCRASASSDFGTKRCGRGFFGARGRSSR